MKIKISKTLGALLLLAATSLIPTVNAANLTCALTDVTFGVESNTQLGADKCDGWHNPINSGDATSLATVNTLWDGGWTQIAKEDSDGIASNSFLDIDFTLSSDIDSPTGAWTLTWVDSLNVLPLTLDFAALFKSSQGYGVYLFEAELLYKNSTNGSGTFLVKSTNKHNITQELSHVNIFARESSSLTCTPPAVLVKSPAPGVADQCVEPDPTVPEPAPLFLISTGIIGFWVNRKNIRKSK